MALSRFRTVIAPAALVLAAVLPGAQEVESEWIPFEFFRESYVFVDVVVEGVATSAALDSGAGMTCLDAGLARQLGLEGGTTVAAQGVGGTVSAELFHGVDFEVGGLKVENVSVIALDLSYVARGLGHEFPAILGRNFFTDYVVDIDYPERRVAFRDPQAFEYDGPGFELELFDTQSGLWAIELELGAAPARLLVDTGSGGPLGIDAAPARSCGLLEDSVASTTTLVVGVGGMELARIASLAELVVGDTVLEDVPTRYSTLDEAEASAGKNVEVGAIGTPLLARFRAIFDVPRQRLILEPHAEAVDEPFVKNRIGLEVDLEANGLRVVHVCAGSPAAAAGWTGGELIVAIDDQPIDESYWRGLYRWRRAQAGTLVVLQDSAGRRRELTAAEYY